MLFSGCAICQHDQRAGIDQALADGVSVRGVAASFPGTSKSAIDRHKRHLGHQAKGVPAAPVNPVANSDATTTPRPHRTRTRPAPPNPPPANDNPPLDSHTRATEALWRRRAGQSTATIAAALNVSQDTVEAELHQLRERETAALRSTSAEEHVALALASNKLIVSRLTAVYDRATGTGDNRTALECLKELRQLARADIDLLRDVGNLSFHIMSAEEQERQREQEERGSLARLAQDFIKLMAQGGEGTGEQSGCPEGDYTIDVDAIIADQEARRGV